MFLVNILVVFFVQYVSSLQDFYTPKYCVNCKHFIESKIGNEYGRCKLFTIDIEDTDNYLVTGISKKDIRNRFCTTARTREDMCGIEGKKFEEK